MSKQVTSPVEEPVTRANVKELGALAYSSSDSSIDNDSSSEDASDHEAYVRDKVAAAAVRIKQLIIQEEPASFFNKDSAINQHQSGIGSPSKNKSRTGHKRRKIVSIIVRRPTQSLAASRRGTVANEPFAATAETVNESGDFVVVEPSEGESVDEREVVNDSERDGGKWGKTKRYFSRVLRTLLRRRHKLTLECLTHTSMFVMPEVPLPVLQLHYPNHDLSYLQRAKEAPHRPRTLEEFVQRQLFFEKELPPGQSSTTAPRLIYFRLWLFDVLDSRIYELLMLLVVIASCVFVSGSSGSNTGIGASTYRIMDILFAAVFGLEFLAKTMCLGVALHKGSYVRSLWNILDAMLLVIALVGLGFTGSSYGKDLNILRPVRAARPLRALNVIGGLGIITRALARSASGLLSVALLIGGALLIAGIVTVQLWSGSLHQRCYDPLTQHVYLHMFCAFSGNLQVAPPEVVIDDQFSVTNTGTGARCPDGLACGRVGPNPSFGYGSYDNLGSALLQVLQVASLESWSGMLFRLYEISGPSVIIFFFVLVLMGAFFIPNLILAIFNEQFGHSLRVHNRRVKAKAKVRELKKYARVIEVIHTLVSSLDSGSSATSKGASAFPRFSSTQVIDAAIATEARKTHTNLLRMAENANNESADPEGGVGCLWNMWLALRNRCHTLSEGYELFEYFELQRSRRAEKALSSAKRSSNVTWSFNNLSKSARRQSDAATSDEVELGRSQEIVPYPGPLPDYALNKKTYVAHQSRKHLMGPLSIVMMFVLLVNLVFLSLHHHNEPATITNISRIGNYAFVALFGTEIVIRMVGLGITAYVSDVLLIMDLAIFIISLIEFFALGTRSVSALRAVRLVRLVPFFRMFPYVRNVLHVLERSAHLFAYALLFSILMVLLAATVGLALFDEQLFDVNDPLPLVSYSNGSTNAANIGLEDFWRLIDQQEATSPAMQNYTVHFSQNYDPVDGVEADIFRISGGFSSMQEALLTVFEVLAVDGWNNLMYAAMESTSGNPAIVAIYFVIVAVFLSSAITGMFLSLMIVSFIATSAESSAASDNDDQGHPRLSWRGIIMVYDEQSPQSNDSDSDSDDSEPGTRSQFIINSVPLKSLSEVHAHKHVQPKAKPNHCPVCSLEYHAQLPPPPLSIPKTTSEIHRDRNHCKSVQIAETARATCSRLTSLVADAQRGAARHALMTSMRRIESMRYDRPFDSPTDEAPPAYPSLVEERSWPRGLSYRSSQLMPETWDIFDSVAKNLEVLQQRLPTISSRVADLSASRQESNLSSSFQAAFGQAGSTTALPSRAVVNRLFHCLQAYLPPVDTARSQAADPPGDLTAFTDTRALQCLREFLADSSVVIDTLALGQEFVGGASRSPCGPFREIANKSDGDAKEGSHERDDEDGHDDEHGHHDTYSYFPSTTPTARILALHVVESHGFHRFILICIFLSCATLVLNSPRFVWSAAAKTTLLVSDICLLSVFVIDIVLKMFAYGVWNKSKESFFRSGWNIMDLFVVVISFAALGIPKSYGASSASNTLKAMKSAKALLPLEFIVHLPGLQIVSHSLIGAAGSMLGVGAIAAVNFIVFGIIGVNLFMGSYHHCSDPAIVHKGDCYGEFHFTTATHPNETFHMDRRWVVPVRNFDHLGTAILTLFELGTGSGMGPAMFEAITNSQYYNPRDVGAAEFAKALYFIVFYVVTRYIIANLFVAVVVFHLNTVRYRTGTAFLTAAQTSWVESKRLLYHFQPASQPSIPADPYSLKGDEAALDTSDETIKVACLRRVSKVFYLVRLFCFYLINNSAWELAMFSLIVLNTAVFGMAYYGMSDDYADALDITNHVFSFIFIFELVARLMAAGFVRCLQSGWFRLDLLIVVLSVVDFALFVVGTQVAIGPSIFRALRLLRILRLMRLLKNRTTLELLAEAALFSLPPLLNVFLLLLVILFIYAIAGVQLFTYVTNNGALNEYYNFHHLGNALQLLFVMATGELWTDIMHACMVRPPSCGNTDCGIDTAPVYFITFMIVTRFVLINVFVEVVLETYAAAGRMTRRGRVEERNAGKQKRGRGTHHHTHGKHHPRSQRRFLGDLEVIRAEWELFDPTGTMRMPMSQLPLLLSRLPLPMGFTNSTSLLKLREHRERESPVASKVVDESSIGRLPFVRLLRHLRVNLPLVNFSGYVHFHDLLVKEGLQIFEDLSVAKRLESKEAKKVIAEIPQAYRDPFASSSASTVLAHAKKGSDDTEQAKAAVLAGRAPPQAEEGTFRPTFEPILDALANRDDIIRSFGGGPTTAEKWFAARCINAASRGWLVRKKLRTTQLDDSAQL